MPSFRSRHGFVGNGCRHGKYLSKVTMDVGIPCLPSSNPMSVPTVDSYPELYFIKQSCISFYVTVYSCSVKL